MINCYKEWDGIRTMVSFLFACFLISDCFLVIKEYNKIKS